MTPKAHTSYTRVLAKLDLDVIRFTVSWLTGHNYIIERAGLNSQTIIACVEFPSAPYFIYIKLPNSLWCIRSCKTPCVGLVYVSSRSFSSNVLSIGIDRNLICIYLKMPIGITTCEKDQAQNEHS